MHLSWHIISFISFKLHKIHIYIHPWSLEICDFLPPPLGTRLHVTHRHICRKNTPKHKINCNKNQGFYILMCIYMKLLWMSQELCLYSINSNLCLKLNFMLFAVKLLIVLNNQLKSFISMLEEIWIVILLDNWI